MEEHNVKKTRVSYVYKLCKVKLQAEHKIISLDTNVDEMRNLYKRRNDGLTFLSAGQNLNKSF